jgi:uncharacterized protein YggU (UPF0235/DUF167 family)
MRIFVKAKAGAKENKVVPPLLKLIKEEGEKEYYIVHVKEPPRGGLANDAIRKALAKFFKVSSSDVQMISGSTSKTKVYEI